MANVGKILRTILFGAGLVVAASPSKANGPVVDYGTILTNTVVSKADETFTPGIFKTFRAGFVSGEVRAVLTRQGDDEPIKTYSYRTEPIKGVIVELLMNQPDFLPLATMGEGDFTLTFFSGDTTMTAMDFSLATMKSGDAFNPVVSPVLEGDWPNWALLRIPFGRGDRDDSQAKEPLQLVNWSRNTGGDEMSAEIRLDGDLIAHGRHWLQEDPTVWQRGEFDLKFPDNKGGKNFKITDLNARDGRYDLFFILDGNLVSAFQFEVKGGREVYHPRQAADHEPRTQYLLPRQYQRSNSTQVGFDVVWMAALSADDAKARFEGGPAESAVAGEETRAKWQWRSAADASRPTALTLTEVATLADTTIRVGDEIIVFGTDYPAGLHWMKVGDRERREIPEGETYDSKVFAVCGRKIVLTRKNTVSIFDTVSEEITALPESDIFMKRVIGGNHGLNHLVCDGHLVAVVNDTQKVTDKLTIKVIDISGDVPAIIPIKNGPYKDQRVDSIAVSAAEGMVAIASSNDNALYTAPVSSMANQTEIKLDDYKAVRASQIFIDAGGVVYADDEYKVRHLPFGSSSPKLLTDQGFGGSSNGFFADNGRLVVVTAEKFGDRYEMALGELPNSPRVLDGTGTAIEGTSGSLGMAGQAAVAPDGTVFLAGTPRGGVGTGEHLQVLDSARGSWLPVAGPDGTVFGAIDVVSSQRLAAFKYGDRNDIKIGYITFGEKVSTQALVGAD